MTILKSLILSIVFLIIIQSCNRHEKEIFDIDEETKKWAVFKTGTWWLYKNTRTNLTDTWNVHETYENIVYADEVNSSNYKFNNLYINTTDRKDTFYFQVFFNTSLLRYSKLFGTFQYSFMNSDQSKYRTCENNKFSLINSDSTNGICTTKEFDTDPYPCNSFFPKNYIWKRNIGITRMIYWGGDTLVLIDQHIIQ